MSDKVQLIKAEIERRINDLKGYVLQKESDQRWVTAIDQLTWVKAFIDSLPEENHFEDKSEMVNEDLEEEINKYITGNPAFADEPIPRNLFDYCIIAAARHFAEWQKQKAMQDFLEKACEFLKSYRQDTPDGFGYIAGIVDDETIEQFKKHMQDESEN